MYYVKFMQKKTAKNLKISINDLLLFSIHSVISNNEQCSFDRLIKECFVLFPDAVKFSRYPIWPDSRKLDRPLRILRIEKLVVGNPKSFFKLTEAGIRRAALVEKTLRQGKLL